MKKHLYAGVLLVVLAACGSDDQAGPALSTADFQVETALTGLATLPSSWSASSANRMHERLEVNITPGGSEVGPGEKAFRITLRTSSDLSAESDQQVTYQAAPFRILRVTVAGGVARSVGEPLQVPASARTFDAQRIFDAYVDRIAASTGSQGNPVDLAMPKRTPLPPQPHGGEYYRIDLGLEPRSLASSWLCLSLYGYSDLLDKYCFAIAPDGTATGAFRAELERYLDSVGPPATVEYLGES